MEEIQKNKISFFGDKLMKIKEKFNKKIDELIKLNDIFFEESEDNNDFCII